MVLFVHGRPSGHPLHLKYGQAVTAQAVVEDPWIRWHDRNMPAPFRYFAWFVNAFAFVRFRRTIVITECLRITLVMAKYLSLGNIKLVILVDDESPYFIFSNYYSAFSKKVNVWAYRQYDAWICIGKMETELVKSIVDRHDKVFTGFNGVNADWLKRLSENVYNPSSNRIVFIGNITAAWRVWYKGLDLMVEAVAELIREGLEVRFDIAGEIEPGSLARLSLLSAGTDRIQYIGGIAEPYSFFKDAGLYLHTARGEAWGLTVNEAMAAGVVPLVSEWTGSKECAEVVSNQLVVELEREKIKLRIKWFMNLPVDQKQSLSEACRLVSRKYTEAEAIAKFEELFKIAISNDV